MNDLTIAYITSRHDPKIEWFFDSLTRQTNEYLDVIVVSLHHIPLTDYFLARQIQPKPNVWQGRYRLTSEDWFAAANARNTALCLCDTEWIAYVDDLSVLFPGWLDRVKAAMAGNYNVAGSYRKVRNLVVEDGLIKSFDPFSDDSRLRLQKEDVADCDGGWLYGCSCAFRTEHLLDVGGWPEICDGLGSEDYCLGIVLKNVGKPLKYDKLMMTIESEDHHRIEPSLARKDKGTSPRDKSHAVLQLARSSNYFPNYFEGGMFRLREQTLAGHPFPVIQEPQHDWFDNQPIREMTR